MSTYIQDVRDAAYLIKVFDRCISSFDEKLATKDDVIKYKNRLLEMKNWLVYKRAHGCYDEGNEMNTVEEHIDSLKRQLDVIKIMNGVS